MQEVLEADCRHERRAGALALEQGVRRHRRPVGEALELLRAHRPRRGDDGLLLPRSRRHLGYPQLVSVEQDGVRERAAHVDAEDRHMADSPRLRSRLPGAQPARGGSEYPPLYPCDWSHAHPHTERGKLRAVHLTIQLAGPAGEPVDLWRTLVSHGVADLPPMRVDEEERTLTATLALPGMKPRTVVVRPAGRSARVDV